MSDDKANDEYISRLESTIARIDRLYKDKEDSLEEKAKIPPQKYAHTLTGQRLSELIDQMDADQKALFEQTLQRKRNARLNKPGTVENTKTVDGLESERLPATTNQTVDVDVTGESTGNEHLASTANPNILLVDTKVPLPVDVDVADDDETLLGTRNPATESLNPGPPDEDEISQMFRRFEAVVRSKLQKSSKLTEQEIQARYEAKLKRVQRAAAIEVKKRQELLKNRFELHYKKKEIALRKHYKKLMVLANKVTEQKSQLEEAKRQFEDKLQAANALYKEVEIMRATMRKHLEENAGGPGATENPDHRTPA